MELTSVIIPIHDAHDYTWTCIESIKKWTKNYEIIIVDNGSVDPVPADITGLNVVSINRLSKNEGFPVACNVGARNAKAEYICILNNDVIVTPGWLAHLISHIEKSHADIIGPCSNYVAGMQQRRIGIYEDEAELFKETRNYYNENMNSFTLVNWIIGLCMVMKTHVWRDIGGFDERFGLGNSEDLDFCMTAIDRGYRIAIAEDVYIHHFGSVTHKILDLDYDKLLRENNKKLLEKWGENHDGYRQKKEG